MFYSINDHEVVFSKSGSVLHISKPEGVISVTSGKVDGQNAIAILGIIRLRLAKYVIVIKEAEVVGELWDPQHKIYKVKKYDFIPLREWRVKDDSERQYLQLLRNHLDAATLFFSPTWDLTNPPQRQELLDNSVPMWQKADDRFFWNRYVCSDLIDCASKAEPVDMYVVSEFIQPVLYGVVSIQHTTINGHPVIFSIISRRSRFRAGTRYFRRGIDSQGHVANFNETEQLLVLESGNEKHVFSYLQTRGSVPAYWGEINNLRYKPILKLGENIGVDAAKAHFDRQTKIYGHNILVNLVNSKGYEQPVKEAYERTVQANPDSDIDYVYFDFHKECSKMKWHRVDVLLNELLSRGLAKMGWYEAKIHADGTLHPVDFQKGVVRTNCMDCLDRTNVVQSHIGKWVLQQQLEKCEFLKKGQVWESDDGFLQSFRAAWADNADGVSCSYSGTGALKTDFTRFGKRTRGGELQDLRNSITRYVKNNFLDGPRQDGFDLFLGNHLPYETVHPPFNDRRPLYVQAVPYIAVAMIILIFNMVVFPKKIESGSWIIEKSFLLLWVGAFTWALRELAKNGLQYVSWPKLYPVNFVRPREVLGKSGENRGWIYEIPGFTKEETEHKR